MPRSSSRCETGPLAQGSVAESGRMQPPGKRRGAQPPRVQIPPDPPAPLPSSPNGGAPGMPGGCGFNSRRRTAPLTDAPSDTRPRGRFAAPNGRELRTMGSRVATPSKRVHSRLTPIYPQVPSHFIAPFEHEPGHVMVSR